MRQKVTQQKTPDLDAAVALLADLVAFPTVTGRSNLDLLAYVETYLERHGVAYVLDHADEGDRANLYATIGEGAGGVVLCGHTDVVPADAHGWSADPFTLVDDGMRLVGRGAVDMKGFLACALAAVPAFKAVEAELSRPLHLLFTFDEEVGSFGAARLPDFFEKQPARPAIAIVGEPTGMRPIVGHKAGLELIAEVTGTAGHASDPRGRVNAIAYAARLIAYLEEKAAELAAGADPASPFEPPYTTISVGRIEGGEARNVIPRQCRFLFEIRPVPSDDGAAILAEIRRHVAETLTPAMQAVAPECGIRIIEEAIYPGLPVRMPAPAADLIQELWSDAPAGVVSFGTDSGYLHQAGIDAVVFGPGDLARAHQPDEFITRAELADGIDFLSRLSRYLAG